MEGARVQTRRIVVEETGFGRRLGAVRQGDVAYHSYLSGADEAGLLAEFGESVLWHREVGGGISLATRDLTGAETGELEFFADQRVLFGFRGRESAAAVVDWLNYHAQFGVRAALIFDRSAPVEVSDFVTKLRSLVEALNDPPRVLVVSCDHPLGQPDGMDASLAASAPGAPAHVRRTPSQPDAWQAPFRETVLLETLRRRFLAGAASVAFLDVCDLLMAGRSGLSAFDRAEAMPGRCLLIEGRETYPWRRKGRDRHVDNVFQRRDERRTLTRWCVAPGGLADPSVWRNIRIGGVKGVVDGMRFVRAMGVRYPAAPVAQIVDKGALAEDHALRAGLEKAFGRKALRRSAQPKSTPSGEGVTVVTAMKNEGPFILDWIAHHRVVGVDRFLIYTNDCDDGTERILDALATEGIVERRDNPYRETGHVPQHAAFRAAEQEAVVRQARWCITMDVDEYMNIHVGQGRLEDLFDATEGANVISMPWRLFGNGDLEAFEDRPVVQQFEACAPEFCARPHQAWGFKTLFRNDGLFRRLGVHRPKGLVDHGRLHWVGGDGRAMPQKMWRAGWRMTSGTWGYDLVTLNHYAVRCAESYLVKRDRGRVNHVDRGQGVAYWFRMNHNAEVDRSIRRYDAPVAAERARLAGLPGVRDAHEASVLWHRRRIAELRQLADFANLYDEITGPRLRHLSRMLRHFGSNVFLSGPDVIPDEVLERPVGGDWQFTIKTPVRAD